MPLHAVLFGAIGTLVETSELQRTAFSTAFHHFDIDVFWDQAEYEQLLQQPGGRLRIAKALQASAIEDESLVDAVYNEKTALFLADLKAGIEPRPGVVNLLEQAGQAGLAVGLVSGTDRQVVDAVIDGAVGVLPSHFDVIISGVDAKNAKPNPEIYNFALEQLGLEPKQCLAIEDTVTSGQAAMTAGISVLFTPGAMTQREDWTSVNGQIANLESLGVGPTTIDALQIWHADQLGQKAA